MASRYRGAMSPLRRILLAIVDPPDEFCRACVAIILGLLAVIIIGAILARLV